MTTNSTSLDGTWSSPPIGRVAAPLREQVIATLRQAILDFDLKPGQRLVERELIERLGVSRTTVREALRQLTSEGLVTVVPQKGATVSAPSLDEAADLYEVRAALESLVVRRFVDRAGEEQVAALRGHLDRLTELADAGADMRTMLAVKDEFYAVLIAGAGSSVLQQLLERIHARVQVLRATSLSQPGRAIDMIKELRALVDALDQRDGALAAAVMSAHVRAAAKTAFSNLAET